MSNHAQLHRTFSETFSERVHGVVDWNALAPVAGWTARSVVEHLLEWFPAVLASGSSLSIPPGPDPKLDLVGAWEHQRDVVQTMLDDPEQASLTFQSEHMGEMAVADMINQYYTPDIFMHTWDLARATGQDDRLDPEVAQAMFAGMEPAEPMLRASGQFGTGRGPLHEDADPTDRLISFIGRDPYWTPSAS